MMNVTLYSIAARFSGNVKEITGTPADPAIVWFLQSCDQKATSDEIPWCSAFMNRMAWLLNLPRSGSLAARSWLNIGTPISVDEAVVGNDILILKRGTGVQPGPEVINAAGHVTIFAGRDSRDLGVVLGLGGNQSDGVTIGRFKIADILGVRRLAV
jgi:uncharacterized protein (TIGR02594 family)